MTSATTTGAVEEFRRLSDDDPELQAHGRYYSCSFLLDMDRHRFLVRMHRGKVEELITDPEPLAAYDFAIRADAETWQGFCQETPPPMCHGIWAATFRRGMRLEGDLLVLMQNLRCVTRQLELLRVTGPLGPADEAGPAPSSRET
ncbi:hypothetical protein [Streptomyces sp. NPDC003697]